MKNDGTTISDGTGPLAVSVIWLLLTQLLCVLAWDFEFLTRQAALVHWLVVGVLPPALALAQIERPEAAD